MTRVIDGLCRGRSRRSATTVGGLLLGAVLCSVSAEAAIGISPGLFLVRNVKPGAEVSLLKNGLPITVLNRTKRAGSFCMECISPKKAGMRRWEYGYEPMPREWFRVVRPNAEIAANGSHRFELVFKIPDVPANYNRRFVLYVRARRGRTTKAWGVSLAVASRIMVETRTRNKLDGKGAGPIAVVPSGILFNKMKPGESDSAKVKIRNNTDRTMVFARRGIRDYYPEESYYTEAQRKSQREKPHRYFDGNVKPVLTGTWLELKDGFKLKPGKAKTVKIKVRVPKDAGPGQYEELVYFDGDSALLSEEVRRWPDFLLRLSGSATEPRPAAVKRIWELLDKQVREEIRYTAEREKYTRQWNFKHRWKKQIPPPPEKELEANRKAVELVSKRQASWLAALNKIMRRRDFYRAEDFKGVKLSDEVKVLLRRERKKLSEREVEYLNRQLWEAVFPKLLERRTAWGLSGRAAFLRVRTIVVPRKGKKSK